jgi:capsular polysaccharide transport system permease protein
MNITHAKIPEKIFWNVKKLTRNRLFVFTTLIPTLLSAVYFGAVSSDIYISESRFVVHASESQAPSSLGLILKGTGFSKGEDEAYTVQDFIQSRDAARALDEQLGIRKKFSDHSIDLFNRFSAFGFANSFEAFHLYYQKKVNVQLDSMSSIVTLTTRAFSPDEAYKMNQSLVGLSEGLVNRLNERERSDMIDVAMQEVTQAQKRATAASLALAQYRNQKGVIDPEKQSSIPLQQIAKMQDDLVATRSQIAQLDKFARENPQLPFLRQRAELLEQEIQLAASRVTGGEHSLAGIDAQYQRLALEKTFTDKMLASAMGTLEQARDETLRKHVYLERIVQPSLPDYPMEPRRMRNVLAVLLLGLVIWGILSILVAGVNEHHDR